VCWNNSKQRWIAQIKIDYKNKTIGQYIDKQDAINARLKAEAELPITIYPR
jgi:hypothetical protein